MHRNVDHSAIPRGRSVVEFNFSDVAPAVRTWWLVLTTQEADVCDADPGFPVDVTIKTSLRLMTQIWRGDVTWTDGIRSGSVNLWGPEAVRRAMPGWFRLSSFAKVPRPV